MTSVRVGATASALTATLGLAAASWGVSVPQMYGMDMGVANRLGSFPFFVSLWMSMVAAMILPGAAPTVVRRARVSGGSRTLPLSPRGVFCSLDTRRRRGVCGELAAWNGRRWRGDVGSGG